jgi:hypothetical protein
LSPASCPQKLSTGIPSCGQLWVQRGFAPALSVGADKLDVGTPPRDGRGLGKVGRRSEMGFLDAVNDSFMSSGEMNESFTALKPRSGSRASRLCRSPARDGRGLLSGRGAGRWTGFARPGLGTRPDRCGVWSAKSVFARADAAAEAFATPVPLRAAWRRFKPRSSAVCVAPAGCPCFEPASSPAGRSSGSPTVHVRGAGVSGGGPRLGRAARSLSRSSGARPGTSGPCAPLGRPSPGGSA